MDAGCSEPVDRLWRKLRMLNASYDLARSPAERERLRQMIAETYRFIRRVGIARSPLSGPLTGPLTRTGAPPRAPGGR